MKHFNLPLFNNSSSGVFLSGGLDSAILSALILEKVQNENLNIDLTFLTINKTNSIHFVKNILIQFKDRYKLPFQTQLNIDNSGSQTGSITEAIRRQLSNFDHVYTGINQNPPIELVQLSGLYPRRPIENNHKNLVLPFMNMYKTDILNLAVENNLNWIFPITHSCTESNDKKCGTCFACSEREWAFAELGIIDLSP